MSGHSKWATTKHRKAAVDAKRSKLFSKLTGYMGILANTLALGLYVPVIGVYISIFSVVFLWIWYILMAIRLFQWGKAG